jgi:hypothetical protein
LNSQLEDHRLRRRLERKLLRKRRSGSGWLILIMLVMGLGALIAHMFAH